MDEQELHEKKKELMQKYNDLLKQSDKTSAIEIYVPHIGETIEDLTTISPIVNVKCKSMIAGAFLIIAMENTIDTMMKKDPMLKKAIKEIKKHSTSTSEIIV